MTYYIFNGECYCEDCGKRMSRQMLKTAVQDIIKKLTGRIRLDEEDELYTNEVVSILTPHINDTFASTDKWPEEVPNAPETDVPEHCVRGDRCMSAEILSDNTKVGALLSGSLTATGREYVQKSQFKRPALAAFWKQRFEVK